LTELELPADLQAEPKQKPRTPPKPKSIELAVKKEKLRQTEQKEKMTELVAKVAALQAELDTVSEQSKLQEINAASERSRLQTELKAVTEQSKLPELKVVSAAARLHEDEDLPAPELSNLQEEQEIIPEQSSINPPAPVDANTKVKRIIEALLFAAEQPMTVKQLHAVFPELEAPEKQEIQKAIDALCDDYRQQAIGLHQVASGYRFQVKMDMAPWVARLFAEKPPKYSRALLETIAIIAYQQPVTRGDIEEIRGVSVSSQMIRTLLEREWVKVLAHKEVPGRPALYGTTRQFLDYFNLQSLDAMPALEELQALAIEGELEI
jgi:segregation and condensation protein B